MHCFCKLIRSLPFSMSKVISNIRNCSMNLYIKFNNLAETDMSMIKRIASIMPWHGCMKLDRFSFESKLGFYFESGE